jgi:hypothetical protein
MSRLDGELAIITWQLRHLLRRPAPLADRPAGPPPIRRWPRIELEQTDHVWPTLRGYRDATECS